MNHDPQTNVSEGRTIQVPKEIARLGPESGKSIDRITEKEEVRFWSSVVVTESGCWKWKGRLSKTGYGVMQVGGKNRRAHRVSWALSNGPLRGGVCVLHRCDNPKCSNPEHLFLGTDGDNVRDMVGKDRHPKSILRAVEIPIIRNMRKDGVPVRIIAPMFKVAKKTIYDAIRRKTWGHIL